MKYTMFKELHIRECDGATSPVEIVNEKEELIATVYSRQAAHLFKVAPDMYEALKDTVGIIDSHSLALFVEPGVTLEQKMEKALAKVEE